MYVWNYAQLPTLPFYQLYGSQQTTCICTSTISEQILTSSHKFKLNKGGFEADCMKGLLGQVTIFSWQWHPRAHNTWPVSVLFFIVCSKVFQNRFLQNVSALSPTVNSAHTKARKWAILAQWGSWISRLGLSPLNSYHNGLNTAVNTITRGWTIPIMDCKCTVPQSTEQLFWLSPRSL